MARPTKQGIDYFPLDCRFDDKTEMYLIEKGAVGLAVLVTIWQMIYSNEGYFVINNDDLHLLIKRKIDSGINEVSECINSCLRRNVFHNDLHQQHQILTSKALQKRFFDAARKKKAVSVNKQYLLIDVNSYGNLVYFGINLVKSAGNATKEKEKVKEETSLKGEEKEFVPTEQTLQFLKVRLQIEPTPEHIVAFESHHREKRTHFIDERSMQDAFRKWMAKQKLYDQSNSSNNKNDDDKPETVQELHARLNKNAYDH